MSAKFLKPVKGLIVRDPVTKTPLAENGELKDYNNYWRRRVMDGSVFVIEQTQEPVKEMKTEKKKFFNKEENR